MPTNPLDDTKRIAAIVQDAGGKIVGRTRLQKTAFLLTLIGCEKDFHFYYKFYGPYSDEVTGAVHEATRSGLLAEEEHPTAWGGTYSIYTSSEPSRLPEDSLRRQVAEKAAGAHGIALELAATAAYLAKKEYSDPWDETKRRKPDKESFIDDAKKLYAELEAIAPQLPHIN